MPAPDLHVRTLPGSRFSCRCCGACCTAFAFGPVEPEVFRRLKRARFEESWPPAADQPWYSVVSGPEGRQDVYLSRVDGHCVFLRDDDLCEVYTRLGPDARPWFCRTFPFRLVAEADAVTFGLRRECGAWHRSVADGEPITAHLEDYLSLLEHVPPVGFEPEALEVLPGVPLPGDYWRDLEERLLDRVEVSDAPLPTLLGRLRDLIHRLLRRPLHEPDAARHAAALEATLDHVLKYIDVGRSLSEGLEADKLDILRSAEVQARRARDRLGEPQPRLTPGAAFLLREHLRNYLFTKEFVPLGGLAPGLGLFLLDALVSGWNARPGPDGAVDAGALTAAAAPWVRFTSNSRVVAVLREQQAELATLFMDNPGA